MSKESFLTSLSYLELKELCSLYNVPHSGAASKLELITILSASPKFEYKIGMTASFQVSTVEIILSQPSTTDYLIFFQTRCKTPQLLGAVVDSSMKAMNANDELSMFYRGMTIAKFLELTNMINNGSFCISTTDLTAGIY